MPQTLRNQSAEHNRLCLLTPKWLNSRCTQRGMRFAHEVSLGPGYVADGVAIASLQYRHEVEYTRAKPAHGTLKVLGRTEAAGPWVCVFEAKATRSDYYATFGAESQRRQKPIGSLHWVVTPKGLLKPEELPPFWGLLERVGGGLREVVAPSLTPISDERLHFVGYQLLFKRERGYYARHHY